MVEAVTCVHCGAVAKHPVTKTIHGQQLTFCCNGCLAVYEMMHEEEPQAPPVQAESSMAEPSGGTQTITLPIGGMTCANCVATIERSLRKVNGVKSVRVSLAQGEATLTIDPNRVGIDVLKQAVKAAGYRVPG